MTCTLYFKPVVNDGERVGDIQLREILNKKYHDYPLCLSCHQVEFLEGLQFAGVDGASRLIEAIKEYDVIQLYLEC